MKLWLGFVWRRDWAITLVPSCLLQQRGVSNCSHSLKKEAITDLISNILTNFTFRLEWNVMGNFWQRQTALRQNWIFTLKHYQTVVTNCSKERPGSIVTKTLKNRILIPIATSKELHFNADFKYISFIKFSLTNQKLQAWGNLRFLEKSHRILTKMTPSNSAYQRTLL